VSQRFSSSGTKNAHWCRMLIFRVSEQYMVSTDNFACHAPIFCDQIRAPAVLTAFYLLNASDARRSKARDPRLRPAKIAHDTIRTWCEVLVTYFVICSNDLPMTTAPLLRVVIFGEGCQSSPNPTYLGKKSGKPSNAGAVQPLADELRRMRSPASDHGSPAHHLHRLRQLTPDLGKRSVKKSAGGD
jgi:hypothetical protein